MATESTLLFFKNHSIISSWLLPGGDHQIVNYDICKKRRMARNQFAPRSCDQFLNFIVGRISFFEVKSVQKKQKNLTQSRRVAKAAQRKFFACSSRLCAFA
jgi:hypothetical protein